MSIFSKVGHALGHAGGWMGKLAPLSGGLGVPGLIAGRALPPIAGMFGGHAQPPTAQPGGLAGLLPTLAGKAGLAGATPMAPSAVPAVPGAAPVQPSPLIPRPMPPTARGVGGLISAYRSGVR